MSTIFHHQIAERTFLLSSDRYGMAMDFGKATANSYLLLGNERALLFDLAVDEPGLRDYVQKLTDQPLITVISHGHPDHLYHMDDFPELYMHEADVSLPLWKELHLPFPEQPPVWHSLQNGDQLELGERTVEVLHIPGHTMGSVMLWDANTGLLFSGDTIARRLLYGLTGHVPLHDFCDQLRSVQQKPVRQIYSAHDRAPLPVSYIDEMIRHLRDDMKYAKETWHFPPLPEMIRYVQGDEASPHYADIAIPRELTEQEAEHR